MVARAPIDEAICHFDGAAHVCEDKIPRRILREMFMQSNGATGNITLQC